MAIRMTGLVSGMDTEGIIKELMSAKSLKKTKIEQRKTKLEWTKEKWADLNTKLYKLYSEQASKLRLESTYNAKKASSSNEQKLGVTASSAAANGSYTLKVSQIATSQYVTGAVLDPVASKPVTASTKLTDIDATLLNRQIEVNTGTDVSHFQIKADSTVADMVSAFSQAGLNASFDEKQQRFFFSSKKSGAANTFTVTTTQLSNEEVAARNAIEDYIGYAKLNTANRKIVQDNYAALAELTPGSTEYTKQLNALSDVAFTQKTATNQDAARNVMRARVYQEKYDEVYKETKEKYYDNDAAGNFTTIKENISKSLKDKYLTLTEEEKNGMTEQQYIESETNKALDAAADKATVTKVNDLLSSDTDIKARLAVLEKTGLSDLSEFDGTEMVTKFGLTVVEGSDNFTKESVRNDMEALVQNYIAVGEHSQATVGALEKLGMMDLNGTENEETTGLLSGMAIIGAKDSHINLNGADLVSDSASFSVNGVTLDLKGETAEGESISFTVSTDVDGIYNSVKTFVTEYNALMKEMNTSYNAATAKGYEPLSDEEKEAMSDDQIKKWEDKIKSSLLRNDSTLGNLTSAMRSALSSAVEVDGKSYSLSSFGIMTSTDYTEGGLLHIYGDATDATYAASKDKLKAAIEATPDLVTKVISEIGKKLYDTMADKMKTSKVSSALTFYNDKQIKSQLEDYEDQIDEWTDRLEDMEDDYYDQFSAMETAMAKLQSQQNSMSSLFGS